MLYTVCIMAVSVFIYIRMHKLNNKLLRTPGIFSLSFVALRLINQSELVVAVSLTCFGYRVSYWWSSGVLYCLVIKVLALSIHFSYLFPSACGERRYLFLRREAITYSVMGVLCPSL